MYDIPHTSCNRSNSLMTLRAMTEFICVRLRRRCEPQSERYRWQEGHHSGTAGWEEVLPVTPLLPTPGRTHGHRSPAESPQPGTDSFTLYIQNPEPALSSAEPYWASVSSLDDPPTRWTTTWLFSQMVREAQNKCVRRTKRAVMELLGLLWAMSWPTSPPQTFHLFHKHHLSEEG